MTQTQQGAAQPGQYFDFPGVGGGTQWTDQDESQNALAATIAAGAQTIVQGLLPFKQTDVVVDWQLTSAIAQTYTAGTSALTVSPYAPWNQFGAIKLLIQNQYASVDVENGIDLYIFNQIRPWREDFRRGNVYANPAGDAAGSTALGYQAVGNAQANLIVPNQFTAGVALTATWNTILRLPASITFDAYYDLNIYGQPTGLPPHSAIISPQYMAGATRQITPTLVLNQAATAGAVSGLDVAPVNIGAGTGAYAFTSATLGFRRKAIYSSDPAVLPIAYPWQYRWRTSRFSISGVSQAKLQVPQDTGQLLSVYCRLWDPLGAGGLGGPIQLSALTRIQVQYGSGLFAFDGTPAQLQADYLEKHGQMLPPGVFCLDLMLDEKGNRSNKRALNLLTTAGVLVFMQFTAAVSAQAYCVMGLESLVYVA